ncbi:hypothetical protein [Xenorhabdus sp. KJ12.1]|uniref:hypothetical protein n=1 Tax=Xenorhabdus sp. KJ12.1 TaxID=1851571 RepID=UPI000C060DFF|nr:hypothetical protein [Xenorhabdus sp. KJ12.1]PHM72240.1 hypothetical protein Xekj_00518 [Xenorhabdus sp. KJ12.1]
MTNATTIQQARQKLVELQEAEETLITAYEKANKVGIDRSLNAHFTDVINEMTELRIQQQNYCKHLENNGTLNARLCPGFIC